MIVTAVTFAWLTKPVPVTVTVVPVGPDVGVKLAIVRPAELGVVVTVNGTGEGMTSPALVHTIIGPDVLAAETVKVICVLPLNVSDEM